MPYLHINLVTAQYRRDVFANAFKVAVPVRHIFISNPCRDVEHDDGAFSLDVVTVAETTKLLLSCGVPNLELDRTEVRCKAQRMNLDTQSCYPDAQLQFSIAVQIKL